MRKIDDEFIGNVKKYIDKNLCCDVAIFHSKKFSNFSCVEEPRQILSYLADDILKIEEIIDGIDSTWQQSIFYIIDTKGYKDSDVYKRASISKQTFSKIRSDINYKPNKDTAIQICFGLKLNLDQTNGLMEKAGFILSNSIKRDLVVEYFIKKKIYNINDLNIVLDELNLKIFPIN